MTERTLVLGGARSGKSAYAESLLGPAVSATYLATGQRGTEDADWQARIAEHVARRPTTWHTVEVDTPEGLPTFLREVSEGEPVLVDDIGNWLTAVLDATDAWSGGPDALSAAREHSAQLVAAVEQCQGRLVLVSAEVGLGVVPETSAGRLFRDELGVLNTQLAKVCQRVVLVVAGIPVALGDSAPLAAAIRPAAAATTAPAAAMTAPAATTATATTVADTRTPRPTTGGTVEDQPEPSAGPTAPAIDEPAAIHFAPVAPPAAAARAEALARQGRLTKPTGSLGRLEELSAWVAACQGSCPPHPFTRPRVVVFAGDHGVAQHGVSAYPSEVTGQMVANFLAGGAAINVLAAAAGATVRVVDMAVDADTPDHIAGYKVRRGSGSIDREDALTDPEVRAAIKAGQAIADEEVDGGADLLVAGDMGIGSTTPSAVLIAALTGAEPVAVVGRGTGIDDAGWMRKVAAIRDALRRARRVSSDPVALLRTAGGADLAAMAGFLAQAAIRRTPVILDGVVVGAAALVAENLAPGASLWWLAGHRSVEPAHSLVLERLGLTPLVDLQMRLGEGSGAVAALPLVTMAVRILAEMATFEDAGVSDRDAPMALA